MHKVSVFLDAQAGSCGKGKFIGARALKEQPDVAINNFMSNAGHTFVSDDGTPIISFHLPTSMVSPNTTLCIGPGAAITPAILFKEIEDYKHIIGNRVIHIHPNAMVILDKHCETERQVLRSGSTFKGCGAAQADKIMRTDVKLFGEWFHDNYNSLPDFIKYRISVEDTARIVNHVIDMGGSIFVEGSQGFDLDINYGLDYPHTTSRQCHAGQLVADCGISPVMVTDIIMIMRPYPIRISSETNLTNNDGSFLVTSSGDYAGSPEITWDIVKERCGAPLDAQVAEITTVTKKMRRVFEMNWERFDYACLINRPTEIALNFAQYLDWSIKELNTDQWRDPKNHGAFPCVIKFCCQIEENGIPVTMIGTGAKNDEIIFVRR